MIMSQILERVVDVILRIDHDLNIKFISNDGLRWLGGVVPTLSSSFVDLIHKDDIAIFKDAYLGKPESFSCEVRLIKNSEEVWTTLKCCLLPVVNQYMICVFDISKWKNSECNLIYTDR